MIFENLETIYLFQRNEILKISKICFLEDISKERFIVFRHSKQLFYEIATIFPQFSEVIAIYFHWNQNYRDFS